MRLRRVEHEDGRTRAVANGDRVILITTQGTLMGCEFPLAPSHRGFRRAAAKT